ncbi:MAG: nucleoside deaminase [Candidatus Electrothrix sp. AW2]|nr:nucleoside deaminase [Candidatus Electrothrix sp. AX1]MCI5133834.1 nucleoside deaminase [Candidatus Electrothrix gigas]MCI5178415.1 nucleoside deaminase [Candidatus Electrothrix gigas]MCI5181533.1 nucleoside deaminase [Candidatus Electrothrix gigas]MCI5194904.1 nucleoside deaminase [Candidatus Electrothrix gigas]
MLMEREEQNVQDFYFMGKALHLAAYAASQNEVPVGAVLVDREYTILAKAGNNCIQAHDPTGHAEMHTLRAAAKSLKNYRLPETTMYVTLEPCPMCAAAMIQARVERIVFGAVDPKGGGLQSQYTIGRDRKLNHSFTVVGGVRAEECAALLKDFFQQRRKKR